jgi:protein SCO1/2
MRKWIPFLLPVLILGALGVVYLKTSPPKRIQKTLPILGNHRLDTLQIQGSQRIDTIWHTIPPFAFTNQKGKTITDKDVEGKIRVVDYFFSTCQSICPIMSNQLERVYKERPEVLILSHTVDPETDTPEVLDAYATKHGAEASRWMFLTGTKPALYEQARKGYLLDAQEGNGGEEDFIHTQNFALVDQKGRIRGYYDGTDSNQVSLLITDIGFLINEGKGGN